MTAWWPVFIWSAMQEDDVELFELNDVVTWPVRLVDAASEPGWPVDVGIQTSVELTIDGQSRSWATTPEFDVVTRLAPADAPLTIRAGLVADFFEAEFFQSCVTGTVRRIEVVSTPAPRSSCKTGMTRAGWSRPGIYGVSAGPSDAQSGQHRPWDLTETPVAPIRFAHGRGDEGRFDHGMLVHLELFRPHCRCREIGSLGWATGSTYAMRHLRQISAERFPGTARYRCPDTGLIFAERTWTPRPDPAVPDHQPDPQIELRREDR